MTARHIATARWRALDREGHDTCRLSQTKEGWILVGHTEFRDILGLAAINYVVRCDRNWITQGADIAGQHSGHRVQAKIEQLGDTWWLDGKEQPDVKGARDVDLSFTPATNLMPLRRLDNGGKPATAAWLQYPCAKLVPLVQTYTPTDVENMVRYYAKQTDFAADLTLDRSGFVTHYPGFWEGEVSHAD